ncbi:MAG: hypothetical protein GJU72_14870 [Acidithiobacillus ferriphilus]|nr:hypothetical protein [Acidithiobacillus ferriphilus]MBW9254358.1 hypothetical protein [Acidithiobacillus ferriphilus]
MGHGARLFQGAGQQAVIVGGERLDREGVLPALVSGLQEAIVFDERPARHLGHQRDVFMGDVRLRHGAGVVHVGRRGAAGQGSDRKRADK